MQDKEIQQALQEQDEITNAVTMDPVNRRNAFVLANSKTGKMIRPDVYSNKTVLRLLKANNPRDPFTRKPLVQKRGVDGAVMAIRAPKFVRKIMQSKNPSKIPLSKKETRVKTVKDAKKRTKRIKVTMYLAEGKGSYKHGVRINNDPFVTPWEKVKKPVIQMIYAEIGNRLVGKGFGFDTGYRCSKEFRIKEIIRLSGKRPEKVFDSNGVFTKIFTMNMFEFGHKQGFIRYDGAVSKSVLKSVERAFDAPRGSVRNSDRISLTA